MIFRYTKAFLFAFFCFVGSAFPQLFTDASASLPNNGAMGQSMDVRAADLDKDGDADIILANEFQGNTILINEGNGNFSNGTAGNLPQRIQDSEDVAIADFNMDGHLDLVFCSEDDFGLGESNVHEYYLGDGTGKFTAASFQLPDSKANAVITAFVNNDTFPDLIFGNDGQNFILINDGAGHFTDETAQRLPSINDTTQDLMLADVDNDGDEDLFVGNENGNRLLINNGEGEFEDQSSIRLPPGLNIETRKIAFGDIDKDEDLDIFLSNVAFIPGKNRQNRLFENDGNGFYTDITSSNLPTDLDHTIDAVFFDVNFDNDLDLVIGNVFNNTPIRVYTNNGEGQFQDSTLAVLGVLYFRDALGIIAEDLNNDQSPDLYICDRNTRSGNKDLLLLNAQEVVSVKDFNAALSEQTRLFPNPSQGYLFIELPERAGSVFQISLFDTKGELMQQKKITSGDTSLFLEFSPLSIPKGMYFLEITCNEGIIVKKVLYQ